MRTSSRESGQAAVETAIVMPLFVFIVLGIVQLSLLHQARLLTKYAAYKAARAGSVNRADLKAMKGAAVGVMVPMIVRANAIASGSASKQAQYGLYRVSSASEYTTAFKEIFSSRDDKMFGKDIIEVTICHPLSADLKDSDDFDDPKLQQTASNADWRPFEKNKLSVQVTTYLVMIVPFANAFLWWASLGQMDQQRVSTMKTLRMKQDNSDNTLRKTFGSQPYTLKDLKSQAEQGNYIMPIRASFSMRMHSNLSKSANLPDENKCHVPFDRK